MLLDKGRKVAGVIYELLIEVSDANTGANGKKNLLILVMDYIRGNVVQESAKTEVSIVYLNQGAEILTLSRD